jgi:hypothetical protein
LSTLNLPVPTSETPAKRVSFEEMIEKWGRGKSKQSIDNMKAKCRRFIDLLAGISDDATAANVFAPVQ